MSKETKASYKQKSRFDGLDVAAMVVEVKNSLIGHKLANVYDSIQKGSTTSSDSSAKSTLLFKLANPNPVQSNANQIAFDSSEDTQSTSHRSMLLIESGVRFHNTTFYTTADSNSSPPSPFAMKLRKHLRNLRLENITQLGNMDRVVDFRFGSGHYTHHLIVEFYGQGNIILTNDQYIILALLRVHEYSADTEKRNTNDADTTGQVKVRVGNVYPVTYATTIKSHNGQLNQQENIPKELIQNKSVEISSIDLLKDLETELEALKTDNLPQRSGINRTILEMDAEEAYLWATHELQIMHERYLLKLSNGLPKKKKDNEGAANLKMLLLKPNSGVFHYGPSLIEHCILSSGLDPSMKITLDTIENHFPPAKWKKLLNLLHDEGQRVLHDFSSSERKGYIFYRNKANQIDKCDADKLTIIPHSDKLFEEFQPYLFKQHENRPKLEYSNFSTAVDEFFSLLEGQKRASKAEAMENAAKERLEKIKLDQMKRMAGLEEDMANLQKHAQLVEMHADDVDKAIGVINSALESGMDWNSLNELVDVEQANNNPIAMLMKKLILEKNQIMLALPDTANWSPDSGQPPTIIDIIVSLNETAHGNARKMYDKYRASKEKASKTAEASEKALEAAEAHAQKQIQQAQNSKNMSYSIMMQPHRKQHWFEKFNWFITSDNYLCIGGRDAQQNEQLVKRYLRPGDAYLHADVFGAPTCILRAKRRRTASGSTEVLPLSEIALREAGSFAICRSSAWSSKIVTSAWYVESHQVSKTAPTGEYLTVGSFMIRGKKNYLPPVQLEMGIGVLFRLGDDADIARHVNDRRDFALMALESSEEIIKESISNSKLLSQKHDDDTQKRHEKDNDISKDEDHMNDEIFDEMVDIEKEEKKDHNSDDELKPTKKKGLSAKDRKLIKKYGSLEAAEKLIAKVREDDGQMKKQKENESDTKLLSNKIQSTSDIGNIRGKKAKMKKIARKYADQDEEDRELALMALQGSKKGPKKKGVRNIEAESDNQIKAAAETLGLLIRDSKEYVDKLPDDVAQLLARCVTTKLTSTNEEIVRWDKLDADVVEQLIELGKHEPQMAAVSRLLHLTETARVDNFSASLAGIIRTIHRYGHKGIQIDEGAKISDGKQRKTKAEKEAEKEVWREILAEDGIIEEQMDNDDQIDDTGEISKLTGKPLTEDVILYAIPVCAPYSTMAQYKYRVKLTPGNQKRGKAAKQIVDLLGKPEGSGKTTASSDLRYLEMINAISDNEWIQALIGDVKISSAGASKIVKNQKIAAKKQKNKT